MGRPRTPTELLAARGGLDKPGRAAKREDEPEVDGEVGDPPFYLDEFQSLCWVELVGMIPAGVAGKNDRVALEMMARLLASIRLSPFVDVAKFAKMQALLASFGMTPADRSRVSGPKKKKDDNPFSAHVKAPRLKAV